MELKNVLNQLKSASGKTMQKTASAETQKTSAAHNELFQALNAALTTVDKTSAEQVKTASATDELTKIAQNLAAADQEALVKEAQLYGAAIMDGFVARGAQYNEQFGKTASAVPTEQDFAAWAQANPEEFQKHAEAGYAAGSASLQQQQAAELQKLASTPEGREVLGSFDQGYQETVAQLEKLASTPEGRDKIASFQQGYQDTAAQLAQIANGPGGQEKLAAMRQGFEEGTQLVTKLAGDYYARGYNDTVALLNA